MTEIAEVVTKLEVEIQEKLKEVQDLKGLLENFPDLKRKTGRWGKLADYSKSANPLVNYPNLNDRGFLSIAYAISKAFNSGSSCPN